MSERAIQASLELDGGERYDVARAEIDEAISEGVVARVEIVCAADAALENAAEKEAELTLDLGGGPRHWPLAVARARFAGIEAGLLRYRLELRDRLLRLELARSTRKFRRQSVRSIVDAVLAEHGLAARWQLRDELRSRPYTVQHRESSRHFVERLLEHEGIYYTIDPAGTVVLGDDSRGEPLATGAESVALVEAGAALVWSAPGVHEIRRTAQLAFGTVTLNDHNWKNPRLSLLTSATAERDADLDCYDYPAGYRDPGEGARLARMRLEAERALSRRLEGRGDALAFAPAHGFGLIGEAAGPLAGEYLLVRVEHRLEVPALGADGGAIAPVYHNRFVAIPRPTPFRPALVHRRPVIAGHHTAIVRGPAGEEIHTDAHGRFKAQFHWDREAKGSDEDSRWLRMTQEIASSMTLARVGWEMSVAYLDGDPERPLGVARHINGAMVPSYAQPESKTAMAMRTPSSPATGGYSELKLEDRAGAMRFDVRAEKDLVQVVENDRSETIGHDELHVIGTSLERVVVRDQTVTIGGDARAHVNGDDVRAVGGDRRETVGGDVRVEVGTVETLSVAHDDDEEVASLRLTVAGGVGPPSVKALASQLVPSPQSAGAAVAIGAATGAASGGGAAAGAGAGLQGLLPSAPTTGDVIGALTQGSIRRVAETTLTRMVGGALVSVAVDAMSTKAGLGYAETVGGAKISIAGKDMGTNAGEALVTTVGGAIVRLAQGDMSSSAELARTTVGGIAQLGSQAGVSIKAETVEITAAASLTLASGALRLALEPGKTSIAGELLLDAGSAIQVTGCSENLTKG